MFTAFVQIDVDEIYKNLTSHDKERFIESHLNDVSIEDRLDSIEDIEAILKYVESYDYKIVRPPYEQSPEDKLMGAIFGEQKPKSFNLDNAACGKPTKMKDLK